MPLSRNQNKIVNSVGRAMARQLQKGRNLRQTGRRKGKIPIGMGQSVFKKLRYHDQVSLDPGTAGAISTYIFRLNSMYDPDETSTGHEPRYFSELMQFYETYTVLGAKITMRFASVEATYPITIGYSVEATTGITDATANGYIEGGHGKWFLLGNRNGMGNKTMTHYWSTKKYFKKSNVTDEYDLTGKVNTNPASPAYFHLWAEQESGQDTSAVLCDITIDYYCLFREPLSVAQS